MASAKVLEKISAVGCEDPGGPHGCLFSGQSRCCFWDAEDTASRRAAVMSGSTFVDTSLIDG